MVGLGPLAEVGLFELHKIAHMRSFFKHRTGPQAGIGPHQGRCAHAGLFYMGKGADFGIIGNHAVAHNAVRGHACATADTGVAVNFARAGQLCAGFNLRQRPHAHRTGSVHNNARRKQPVNNAGTQGFFHARKFHG